MPQFRPTQLLTDCEGLPTDLLPLVLDPQIHLPHYCQNSLPQMQIRPFPNITEILQQLALPLKTMAKFISRASVSVPPCLCPRCTPHSCSGKQPLVRLSPWSPRVPPSTQPSCKTLDVTATQLWALTMGSAASWLCDQL